MTHLFFHFFHFFTTALQHFRTHALLFHFPHFFHFLHFFLCCEAALSLRNRTMRRTPTAEAPRGM